VLLRPTNQEGATTWDQSVQDALDDNAIQTKIDILRSDVLQLSVIDRLNLTADPEFNSALRPSRLHEIAALPWLAPWMPTERDDRTRAKATLLKHLVIKRGKSYLMTIGYDSANPGKAVAMANALATEFRADQVKRKIQSQEILLASLSDRIKSLEAQYHVNEQAEQDFIESSGLVHRGERMALDRQLASLSTIYAEARNRTIEANSHAEMLTKQRAKGLENTNEALSSPLLQRLRERLVELGSGSVVGMLPLGGSQSNVVSALRQAIEAETLHLVVAAQNSALVAQQNEASLRSEIIQLDLRLMGWEANERHRVDLHRAVLTSLDALHAANERYAQQAGRGDVLQADVEIISFAEVPDRPSFPNPLLYIAGTIALIGLLCGLMLLPRMRIPTMQMAAYDR
jgi:succinoglycan biosynthesis transport protein ExoP